MKRLGAAIAVLLVGQAAFAQVSPPPLSPQCEAPTADIAAPAPLPHTAARLESGATIRILAIGSSSTWGVGASSRRKTYPAVLRSILENALKNSKAEIVNRGVSGEIASTQTTRPSSSNR